MLKKFIFIILIFLILIIPTFSFSTYTGSDENIYPDVPSYYAEQGFDKFIIYNAMGWIYCDFWDSSKVEPVVKQRSSDGYYQIKFRYLDGTDSFMCTRYPLTLYENINNTKLGYSKINNYSVGNLSWHIQSGNSSYDNLTFSDLFDTGYRAFFKTGSTSTVISTFLDNDYDRFKSKVYYSNSDIYDEDGNLFYDSVLKPFIVNYEEVQTGVFDNLIINAGDYSDSLSRLDFVNYTKIDNDFFESEKVSFNLANFKLETEEGETLYSIPSSKFGSFENSQKYAFDLRSGSESLNWYEFIVGTIPEDIQDEQKQDELIETNKSIFETLKDILNYLNPFSEDFFVYKLVDILLDGLVTLFVPSSDFFNDWIDEMTDWLSEHFGFLYYPLSLVLDFFDKIGELDESGTAVLSGSGFELMGAQIIPEFSYDLNSLLVNDTFDNIHTIYLVFVDVIMYVYLVILAKNTFVDIFGGQYDNDSNFSKQSNSKNGS